MSADESRLRALIKKTDWWLVGLVAALLAAMFIGSYVQPDWWPLLWGLGTVIAYLGATALYGRRFHRSHRGPPPEDESAKR